MAEPRHWNSTKTTFQHLETFSRQGTAVVVAKARLTVSIECVRYIKASVRRLRSPATWAPPLTPDTSVSVIPEDLKPAGNMCVS